ncbi:MAG TPA: lysylphosphatidylglycerol synthase transmembrane domain-containing protein [Gemmatimonadaceae bacterium]|nr:lysylphosphatidylglycerol synthase transmembrane domain-containing protein [Gemmatimonadaceae bacterium]
MSQRTRALIGILVSGLFVWLLIRYSGIDWATSWTYVRRANVGLLILSAFAATLIFAIRVPRWRVILPPRPADRRLPFSSLFQSIIIGQMMTNVIPGRAGEIARPYVLSRKEPSVPFSTGVASVVVDRIFDGIVVLLLLLVAMLDPTFPTEATLNGRSIANFALLGTVGLVIGLTGLFVLVLFPEHFIGVFRWMARHSLPRFEEPVARFFEKFAAGLTILKDPRRFMLAFLWTLVHWLVCAGSYWIAYQAIGLDAPFMSALFVQTIIVLAVALPQAPGFIGVFEGFAVLALAVYGIDRELAFAWAITYHVVTYIPVTVLGLIYSIRMGLNVGEIKSGAANA